MYLRLFMFGAASETRGSIAAVVEAYRAHGLFKRWPVDYIATRCDGSLGTRIALVARALRRFVTLLLRHGRAPVHVHASKGGFWCDAVFMAAALAARCPLLVHLHGAGFERFSSRLGPASRAIVRFLFERAACVIVPSEALRASLRAFAHNANVVALPSPVSMELTQPQSRPNLILFLGKLEAPKGVFDLLEAVAAVRSTVPDVRLVCAGVGDRVAVARYAELLGIAEAVKFTGWVGPSGKRALLESAAVFALPSYEEALPVSLLEAMSAGVPVVASPVGGIPEVIVDGVNGYLAAPGDTATLARLLALLLVDRKLGERIGAAARESARLRFAPERTLPRLESIYAALGLAALGLAAPGATPRPERAPSAS